MRSQVHIVEAADQSLRGMLITWTSIFVSLGIVLVCVLGFLFRRTGSSWHTCAPKWPVCCRSLVWLASRGCTLETEASLQRLRGEKRPRHELEALLDCRQGSTRAALISSVLRPEVWKHLFIQNTFLFQQLSGVFIIVFYAVDIARNAGVCVCVIGRTCPY
jgi:hypothetical protein